MATAPVDRTTMPVVLIVGSVLLLSGADAVVKAVSADYSLWQVYAARSAFSVPILLALLWPGGLVRSAAIARPWVVVRSLLLVATWMAYYAALPRIELSVAATAIYTTPLFIAALSPLLASEPVAPGAWLGVALGFVGVLVILRPGTDDFSAWALLPVLGALLYALAAIVTRIKCSAESPLVLALALHTGLLLTGLLGTVVILMIEPQVTDAFLLGPWSLMGPWDWMLMGLLGAIMVAGTVGIARAYQTGPPAVVATFDYAYLVFAVLWGVLFFSERPDGLTIAGVGLIIVAGIQVLQQK